MIVIYSIVAPYNLLVFVLVEQVYIYDDNTPSMIVPRTASPIGMQLATDQIINKIEEEEEKSNDL